MYGYIYTYIYIYYIHMLLCIHTYDVYMYIYIYMQSGWRTTVCARYLSRQQVDQAMLFCPWLIWCHFLIFVVPQCMRRSGWSTNEKISKMRESTNASLKCVLIWEVPKACSPLPQNWASLELDYIVWSKSQPGTSWLPSVDAQVISLTQNRKILQEEWQKSACQFTFQLLWSLL